MIISIDFDGTVVRHEYPNVGADVPGAVDNLRWLVDQGHELVLYTMRSRKYLEHAIDWFKNRGIPLAGIQYAPGQSDWTSSNKCYANIYIGDDALGAPLIYPENGAPYFDWETAYLELTKRLSGPVPNPIIRKEKGAI